jgi:hypothetical protein
MRTPLMMIIFYLVVCLLLDSYLYVQMRRVVRARPGMKWLKKGWLYSTLFSALLLIVALVYPARNEAVNLLPKMWLLFSWLSICTVKILYSLFSLIGKIPLLWRGRRWNLGMWVGLPLGVIAFCMMWRGALVNRFVADVERVEIPYASLPDSFDGFTIAQISDLHLGTYGNDTTFVSIVVDSINALNPDVIFFTGDLVNRYTDEALPFAKTLSRLRAKHGVISILGNHDYGVYMTWKTPQDSLEDHRRLLDLEKSMGWDILLNEHRYIHRGTDSIAIVGVENWGEKPFVAPGDLMKALANGRNGVDSLPPYGSQFKILLTHNPVHWKQKAKISSNVALTLSGHTHAMQCMWKIGDKKISPCAMRYENWGGLYSFTRDDVGPLNLYVNIGVGTVGLPFRIGDAYPEITLITLKKR